MKEDVDTLFKQVKNLRSNSLIYITKCYLSPICQDLDAAVNINVQVSNYRTYKITLHPRSTQHTKLYSGKNGLEARYRQQVPCQDYLDALKSEKESLANFQKQLDEVDTLLRDILLLKDRFHFFFSMGKYLHSFSERKELFEGIIGGVFYVKRYASPIECNCEQENERRLKTFQEDVEKRDSLLKNAVMVQKEKERLEPLYEEREYYNEQNKIFRHFQNYQ